MLDYLIVGAGIFGATCARELTAYGKRVLVIEKSDHVGGMAHTTKVDGQLRQDFGGHIYHTNDSRLWEYVSRYAEMKHYCHHVKATAGGRVYSLPINLTTLQQVWPDDGEGPWTPRMAQRHFYNMRDGHNTDTVEGWCLSNIGPTMYHLLVEGYTRKMWGTDPKQLPAAIIKRLPVRTTWDDRYFSDAYQGLPVDGYTSLVENMLAGIPVEFGQDYTDRTTYWNERARRVVYTGPVDALMGYTLGRLQYRGLRFEHERRPVADYQGCATMNYCDASVPWLRIEEWRHWWAPAGNAPETLITRTYPDSSAEPMYPVNDERNDQLYADYARFIRATYPALRLGGRMGLFRYMDIHQAIAAAMTLVEKELA